MVRLASARVENPPDPAAEPPPPPPPEPPKSPPPVMVTPAPLLGLSDSVPAIVHVPVALMMMGPLAPVVTTVCPAATVNDEYQCSSPKVHVVVGQVKSRPEPSPKNRNQPGVLVVWPCDATQRPITAAIPQKMLRVFFIIVPYCCLRLAFVVRDPPLTGFDSHRPDRLGSRLME